MCQSTLYNYEFWKFQKSIWRCHDIIFVPVTWLLRNLWVTYSQSMRDNCWSMSVTACHCVPSWEFWHRKHQWDAMTPSRPSVVIGQVILSGNSCILLNLSVKLSQQLIIISIIMSSGKPISDPHAPWFPCSAWCSFVSPFSFYFLIWFSLKVKNCNACKHHI